MFKSGEYCMYIIVSFRFACETCGIVYIKATSLSPSYTIVKKMIFVWLCLLPATIIRFGSLKKRCLVSSYCCATFVKVCWFYCILYIYIWWLFIFADFIFCTIFNKWNFYVISLRCFLVSFGHFTHLYDLFSIFTFVKCVTNIDHKWPQCY